MFLILIAVALFAALSYAVTKTSRTSPGGIDKEANKTNFSVLLQYVSSIQSEVLHMQITEGIQNPLFNDSDECSAPPYDTCLFREKIPLYDGETIENIAHIPNDGVGLSTSQDMKDGVLTMFAYLNIHDVGEDVCQQLNDFVQIAGIPQMSSQHDYLDLSADVQSQPVVCVEDTNYNPSEYNILMKAYEAEYV